MKEDVIKGLVDNIDKIFKYISFGMFLFCISISSLAIYYFNIQNMYLIIAIYSGAIFLGLIIKNFLDKLGTKYVQHKMMSKSFLRKTWKKLSNEEKEVLKNAHKKGNYFYADLDDRIALILINKNMVVRPEQFAYDKVKYLLHPWTVRMIEINLKK